MARTPTGRQEATSTAAGQRASGPTGGVTARVARRAEARGITKQRGSRAGALYKAERETARRGQAAGDGGGVAGQLVQVLRVLELLVCRRERQQMRVRLAAQQCAHVLLHLDVVHKAAASATPPHQALPHYLHRPQHARALVPRESHAACLPQRTVQET